MKKFNSNNKGLSLVELLVATAILAIVMTGVALMLSSMSKSFSDSQREISLQDSVQSTYEIVSSLIKEAQAPDKSVTGGYHDEVVMNAAGNVMFIFSEAIDQSKSSNAHKALDGINSTVHIVMLDSAKHKLYLFEDKTYNPNDYIVIGGDAKNKTYSFASDKFNKYIETMSGSLAPTSDYLLAQKVQTFSCDTDGLAKGYVVLDVSLKDQKRTAAITQNVYVRNSNATAKSTKEDDSDDKDKDETDETPSTSAAVFNPLPIKNDIKPTVGDVTSARGVRAYFGSDVKYVKKEVDEEIIVCPNCGHAMIDQGSYKDWEGDTDLKHKYKCTNDENYGNACQYYNNILIKHNGETILPTKTGNKISMDVPVSDGGTLLIRNTTDKLAQHIVVTLYFKDGNSFKELATGQFLSVKTLPQNGNIQYAVSSVTSGSGTCKYIQLQIEQLAGKTGTGDNIKYDDLVLNYDCTGSSPVMCSYYVETNSERYISK